MQWLEKGGCTNKDTQTEKKYVLDIKPRLRNSFDSLSQVILTGSCLITVKQIPAIRGHIIHLTSILFQTIKDHAEQHQSQNLCAPPL